MPIHRPQSVENDTPAKPVVCMDGRLLFRHKGGISYAGASLLIGLTEQEALPCTVVVVVQPGSGLDQGIQNLIEQHPDMCLECIGTGIRSDQKRPSLSGKRLDAELADRGHRVDLFHFFDVNRPVFFVGEYVLTVHDLIPITHKAMLSNSMKSRFSAVWKRWVRRQCSGARAIIAVSECTRRAIDQVYCSEDFPHVHVVHNGILPAVTQRVESDAADQDTQRAVFELVWIGRRDPHKNLMVLVHAMHRIQDRVDSGSVRLTVIGPFDDRYAEPERFVEAHGLEGMVRFTGEVSDTERDRLIESADLFVFPSLVEGFGIPPLEAMGRGVPVLASDIAVHHEVLADAARFVSPSDPEAWASEILEILNSDEMRAEMADRGRARLELFTPSCHAQGVLEVWKSLI